MKKLNVGLVGAGFMGKAHSIGYSDMPKYFWPAPAVPVLKTICDIVPEIAADAKERFGFEKCCTDWRDLRQQLRSKAAQPQNPQPQVPQSALVAKFCGKCGSPLNEAGKCPNCDNNQPQA